MSEATRTNCDWLVQFGVNPALAAALLEFHRRNKQPTYPDRDRYDAHDDRADLQPFDRLVRYPWGER